MLNLLFVFPLIFTIHLILEWSLIVFMYLNLYIVTYVYDIMNI